VYDQGPHPLRQTGSTSIQRTLASASVEGELGDVTYRAPDDRAASTQGREGEGSTRSPPVYPRLLDSYDDQVLHNLMHHCLKEAFSSAEAALSGAPASGTTSSARVCRPTGTGPLHRACRRGDATPHPCRRPEGPTRRSAGKARALQNRRSVRLRPQVRRADGPAPSAAGAHPARPETGTARFAGVSDLTLRRS
jgi:hypothetical protein